MSIRNLFATVQSGLFALVLSVGATPAQDPKPEVPTPKAPAKDAIEIEVTTGGKVQYGGR